MNKDVKGILQKVLFSKGVLYFLTRFCGSTLRRYVFDAGYESGKWQLLDKDHSDEMVRKVEEYSRGGRILDMGCGTGILASRLNLKSFSYYRGIDISVHALKLAQKRANEHICFEQGCLQSYVCHDLFNVIIFEESLYYIPFRRLKVLRRSAKQLLPGGFFIVTISDPQRFAGMIEMIRKHFHIIEDRCFTDSERHLMVFQP
jgi:2-polyprenyl-3-methyl-5-hydroxy-6-metoxy-1,4-benzoquinol methylase